MHVFIIVIHLVVCFALIGIVLLQSGKGASMGAMFGGAGNQTLFGQTGGGSFLGKVTAGAAIIFMVTSLTLAVISKRGDESVVRDLKPASEQPLQEQQEPLQPGEEQQQETPPAEPESGQ
ncbi:MAG: preprotein translocase subunit SecG [Desulfobacterales bacterium]